MKLLDLMLKNGVSWYRDATHAAQDKGGSIWFYGREPALRMRGTWDSNGNVYGDSKVQVSVRADDWNSCVITKGQYTAALRLARTVEPVLAAPPEHPDVFAFKKWYAETLPVVEAKAAGEGVEWFSELTGTWNTKAPTDTLYIGHVKYRIKPQPPKTININGYEVPEPLRVEPTLGARLYCVTGIGDVTICRWSGSAYHTRLLRGGMLHLTNEAAEVHSKALASFTTLEV